MSLHRLVALASATALVGLLGFAPRAEASNFSRPEAAKPVVTVKRSSARPTTTASLREKVRDMDPDGCGGRSAKVSSVDGGPAVW